MTDVGMPPPVKPAVGTPESEIADVPIAASGACELYVAVTPAASIAGTFPTGVCAFPALFFTFIDAASVPRVIVCVCGGRLLVSRVTFSTPPTCPIE
jgi:hypothetical protein